MYRTAIFNLSGRKLSLLILIISAAVFVQSAAKAQENSAIKDIKEYVGLASKAYQAKDYPALVENMKMALVLRPTHQTYLYYLVKGYALSGNKAEALKLLAEGANMGLSYRAVEDKDMDSIRDAPEFKTILAKIESNKLHIGSSEPAFTLPEKGLVTEGIAYDPVEKAFYVSSVYKRKIVKIDSNGSSKDFAADQNDLWSGMGMKIDAKRRLLWIATAANPQMSNYKAEDNGKSAIVKYDLASGKLVKRYEIANKPKPHWFGDLTINSHGDVFATDSVTTGIYVIRADKDELESFIDSDQFVNCQGVAFSDDDKYLFMSDYSKGVFAIEMATKKLVNLPFPATTTMLGIDGLYFYKGSLIGVQNGINPNRLVRMYLAKDFSRVDKFEIVEANNALFDEPTLGVIVDGTFYYNGNSQWGAISEKGEIAPIDKLKEHKVLKLKLQ